MSKKLLALGVIFGLAACGGTDDEMEFEEDFQLEETAPGTPQPAPAPMDTTMMDTTMMDTTMMDTMM